MIDGGSPANAGEFSSITIGTDGLGLVSYIDRANFSHLKVAHCNDIACTTASNTTVGGDYLAGPFTSLAIGTDGLGLIGYLEQNTGDLRAAHCNDSACASATITTLDSTGTERCTARTGSAHPSPAAADTADLAHQGSRRRRDSSTIH